MDGLSIIIPAHNESAVIEHTLRSIVANQLDRALQVIVVANGCTDDTAARARAFGPGVEVIETPVGNKANALNLGDRAARYFPRAYQDADVELSPGLLASIVEAFGDAGCRIAAPQARHIYRGRNPLLAGYYRLWSSLPYVRRQTMARGFFAIDEQLRARFGEFPNLTADDKFVYTHTRPEERRMVDGGFTTVYMPATFGDLLRIKTRWTYGNMELAARRPDLGGAEEDQYGGTMGFLIRRPWLWVHVPVFLYVYWYSHREARRRLAQSAPAWERAETSRSGRRGDGGGGQGDKVTG